MNNNAHTLHDASVPNRMEIKQGRSS